MADTITLDDELQEIVTIIQGTAPDSSLVRPATAKLADLLHSVPGDSSFDVEDWRRQWSAVEAEMKALTRANDVAEGRRE